MAKAFSIEDTNLQSRSLVVSKFKDYSDLDASMELKTSGDVYRKLDAAAVKQSVKNIILTNHDEKPFKPKFGTDIYKLLFENYTFSLEQNIKGKIRSAIRTYEPRAEVERIDTKWDEANNHLMVTVIFRIVNTTELITLNVTLSRVR